MTDTEPSERLQEPDSRRTRLLVLGGVCAILFVLFADVLFSPRPIVASSAEGDVRAYFAPVRAFSYREIGHGNLPLWNPYLYSGIPHLAGFQAQLLYPLNLHYLILPLAKSLNVELFLHLVLMAGFFVLWARLWGISPVASGFGALCLTLGGAVFPHVMAGHLSLLDVWAWSPLAFYAVDRYLLRRQFVQIFPAALVLSIAIYAGHPQATFGVAAMLALYAGIRLLGLQKRLSLLPGLAVVFAAPLVLGAAQLWPGLALASESIRQGGLRMDVAGRFSFPPENIITLIAPKFFGVTEYWGRWFFWEACAFTGIAALSLAIYGIVLGAPKVRFVWIGLAVTTFVLALGQYTPLFGLLYQAIPGFDQFRSPSKFIFFSGLFGSMLAAAGADALLQKVQGTRIMAGVLGALALLLLFGAGWIGSLERSGDWSAMLQHMQAQTGIFWEAGEGAAKASAEGAQRALLIAGATAILLAALYFGVTSREWCGAAILLVGVAELFLFARTTRPTVDLDSLRNTALDTFLQMNQGDYRVWNLGRDNNLLAVGARDFWGYDPAALRRYVELYARTKNADVDDTLNELWFTEYHPAFRLARCAYMVNSIPGSETLKRLPNPMPRFAFFTNVRVESDLEKRLDALVSPEFAPDRDLILESEPVVTPAGAAVTGSVKILDESTDTITMDIRVDQHAIMLVTDAYAKGWRVVPIEPGPQDTYAVMPADHAFRAVPLRAGRHVVRMEYAPASFRYGLLATGFGAALFAAAWIYCARRDRNRVTA